MNQRSPKPWESPEWEERGRMFGTTAKDAYGYLHGVVPRVSGDAVGRVSKKPASGNLLIDLANDLGLKDLKGLDPSAIPLDLWWNYKEWKYGSDDSSAEKTQEALRRLMGDA